MKKRKVHRKKAVLDRRTFVKVLGVTALPIVVNGLTGCRSTDTLTKIIYADWAEEIDHNSPYKAYENVPNADPTPSLPSLYQTNSQKEKEEVELPQYDDVQNEEETEKTEHDSESTSSQNNSTGTKKGEGEGNAEDGDDKNDDGDTEDGSESDAEADAISSGTKQGSVGGDEVGNEASKDVSDEPEKEGSIIAFGEVANIVAMLGGKGVLWSCDDTFYDAAEILYGSEFVKPIYNGFWDNYKSGGKGITKKKFKKLCRLLSSLKEEERPVYLIYDGGVGCPLSKSQAKALETGYGIETLYFFLNQNAYLKNAMNYIQKIIGGDAKKRYDAYWDFHSGLLKHLEELNGGVAAFNGSSTARMNFRDGSTFKAGQLMEAEDMKWTLLVDQWDTAVKYDNFGIEAKKGLGISTLGWKWSPASYYMQYGGVVNNSAAVWQSGNYRNSRTYHSYVWAMGTYYAPPKGKYIKGAKVEADSFTTDATDQSVGVLMCSMEGQYGIGKLGDAKRFPTVVVMNKDQKEWLEYDRDHSGVYAGHYLEKGATSNNPNTPACGVKMQLTSGTSLWVSYVGWTSNASDEYGADSDMGLIANNKYKETTEAYDVVVNPHGYYSNWISGSVESVLEAAWAFERLGQHYVATADRKKIDYEGCSSTEELVSYFYKTFYGESPKDSVVSKVLNGGYAE